MKPFYFIFLALLVSCGGGSGGDESNNAMQDQTNPSQLDNNENCISYGINSQKCSLIHNNLERYYIIYRPTSSTPEDNLPVLFALHGYGSTAETHKSYTQYEPLAENNRFIVVYPQGYKLETQLTNSSSHWNSGAWTIGSNIDDVSFISTLIEIVASKINIDRSRVYSSGMSNGGFMSYHLACNLSSKIAAVASVTGSMSKETYEDCNPAHPTSILQVHGTIDATVPFDGNSALGMRSINDVMDYWNLYNACDVDPTSIITDYFDIEIAVQHDTYSNCLNDVHVELYKIEGMGHRWPNKGRYGISATEIIWEFINTYDINGRMD